MAKSREYALRIGLPGRMHPQFPAPAGDTGLRQGGLINLPRSNAAEWRSTESPGKTNAMGRVSFREWICF